MKQALRRASSTTIRADNMILGNVLTRQERTDPQIEMADRSTGNAETRANLRQDSMSSYGKARRRYVGKGLRAVQGKGMRANAALRHQHVEQALRNSCRSSVRLSAALSPDANHTIVTQRRQEHQHKEVKVVMNPEDETRTRMNEKFGEHGDVVYQQLVSVQEYEPRFTLVVTLIQCLVFGAACYLDGLLPWGAGYTSEMREITRLNHRADVTQEVVTMHNMWLGPSTSTMIHWGAKFSPCMRASDPNFNKLAEDRVTEEEEYGCCFDSYQQCGQTTRETCEQGMSATWTSAGQSCQAMIDEPTHPNHLNCTEVVLRPCCHYVAGACNVTTRDHCYLLLDPHVFHDDKELCGEVDCKPGICGMGTAESQIWRFITPIFMHVGVVHLMMNAVFQIRAVSDLEVVAGSWNTAKIYILTGIGGNVCAALFAPEMPSAGASSSLYGVIAVQLVDLIQSWQLVQNKCYQAFTMLIQLALVLGIGTLPYVDNFAHVGGFIVGLFCGFAYLPYVYFSRSDRLRKLCFHYSSRLALAGGMVVLVGAFYLHPELECSWCHYVNCVPYTDNICDDMVSKG